jgi:hypothetical protein
MTTTVAPVQNVTTVVPLLMVTNMDDHSPSTLMASDSLYRTAGSQMAAAGALGNGAALYYFQCGDALAIYREAAARGIKTLREPQVGNFAWESSSPIPTVTESTFLALSTLPEETLLSDVKT